MSLPQFTASPLLCVAALSGGRTRPLRRAHPEFNHFGKTYPELANP